MFIIQARVVKILLILKLDVNLMFLLSLITKIFRRQYITERTLK